MEPITQPTPPYVITFTGNKIPLDGTVQPTDINIEDIAHALSMLCRFNGHTRRFYSVAQHCVNCVRAARAYYGMTPEHSATELLRILLHDAVEAYIGDIVRPLKRRLPALAAIEYSLQKVIEGCFALPPVRRFEQVILEEIDNRIQADEAGHLCPKQPLPASLEPFTAPAEWFAEQAPAQAGKEYLRLFHKLVTAHGVAINWQP